MGASKELHLRLQEQIAHEVSEFEEGNQTCLDTFIFLREQRAYHEESLSLIKQFEDDYRATIESEADQYPEGFNGYKIEVRGGGKTFDFKSINEWVEANKNLKEIEAKYKQAFESSQKGVNAVTDDGEILEIPTPKYRKGSIIIKKK